MSRLVAAALVLIASAVAALDVPALTGRVNDNAGLLTEQQRSELTQKLEGIEQRSGHQFVFLSIDSLGGQSIEEFAVATAHAWKLGDKKRDDGLLFVIAKADRKMRLEVGYGLEGQIPDAEAVRIVRDVAAPYLKRSDWYGGINALFDACEMATAAPASAAEVKSVKSKSGDSIVWVAWGCFAGLIGCIVALAVWLRRREQLEEQRRRELETATREWASRRAVADANRTAPRASTAAAATTAAASTSAKPKPATKSYSSYDDTASSSSSSAGSYDSGSSLDSGSSSSDSFSGGGGDFGGGGASGDF